MATPGRTPDGERKERITHFKALVGLIANQDAIQSAVARVRKAAVGYTDDELIRFAQLIIMSEHVPGDWRMRRLARLQDREDALEEIATSIDPSWLPTETEEEVFMDELRNEVIRAYPNPDRVGCPDESALRRVVFGRINENPDLDAIAEHTQTCGPCTRKVAVFLNERARR